MVQNRTYIHESISESVGSNDSLGYRQDLQLGSLICDVRAFENKSNIEILLPLATKMVNQGECILLQKFQRLTVSSKIKYAVSLIIPTDLFPPCDQSVLETEYIQFKFTVEFSYCTYCSRIQMSFAHGHN